MKKHLVHFSVDDVIDAFEDIFIHGYASVFENVFFNDLKQLHEEIGLKISLYCYYHNATFSLDQFPDSYKKEFEENSDWLRLGVHAFDHDVAKSNDWRTYYISYIRVMEELIRICGEKVIDFYPRLDCYKLPYEAWKKLENYKYGPRGLLANDRDGESYFLNVHDEKILRRKGTVIVDGKPVIRTSLRLEDIRIERLSGIRYPCICFTHEWIWKCDANVRLKKMIKVICNLNKREGNTYVFPEEIYRN